MSPAGPNPAPAPGQPSPEQLEQLYRLKFEFVIRQKRLYAILMLAGLGVAITGLLLRNVLLAPMGILMWLAGIVGQIRAWRCPRCRKFLNLFMPVVRCPRCRLMLMQDPNQAGQP